MCVELNRTLALRVTKLCEQHFNYKACGRSSKRVNAVRYLYYCACLFEPCNYSSVKIIVAVIISYGG